MSAIDTIVFDIGGVLLDWNPEHLYRKMFAGDEARLRWFLDNVCNAEWNSHQDRGRPFARGIAEARRRHPEWTPYIEAYWDRWIETVAGPLQGTVDLLAALRGGRLRLFGLSNWSAETFPLVRRRYDFLSWFEAVIVSGEKGIAKPDPAIFELLLARHRLAPAATLFVDDNARNVDVARSLGFQVSLFTTPAALRADLERLGLLREGDAGESVSRSG